MLRRLMKETQKVVDRVSMLGGGRGPKWRGMRMPDGSPVSVETIMRTHGVDRERAEKIAQRQNR